MSTPSVGLVAYFTGKAEQSMYKLGDMCIHEMSEEQLEIFKALVFQAKLAIDGLDRYVNPK